ncbi:hypothetical protein KUCAC02_024850 [Chaenocephalus aceratus]|nr:hypothetical protein KUCAC02_024850 [Chaenocephalus aceratus]
MSRWPPGFVRRGLQVLWRCFQLLARQLRLTLKGEVALWKRKADEALQATASFAQDAKCWSLKFKMPGPPPSGLVLLPQAWSSSLRPGPPPSGLVFLPQAWSSSLRPGLPPSGLVLLPQAWSSSLRPGLPPSGLGARSRLLNSSKCEGRMNPSSPGPNSPRASLGVCATEPSPAQEIGKDGTVWTVMEPCGGAGRRQIQNILTESAGPAPHARHSITDKLTAFMRLCENAFIALLYVRGAYCGKSIEMESFWSEQWGNAFNATLSRNRFREIMRYLRFDKKETRRCRLTTDKFTHVRKV